MEGKRRKKKISEIQPWQYKDINKIDRETDPTMIETMTGCITWENVKEMGWVSPDAYLEVTEKYDERIKKLSEKNDELCRENSIIMQELEKARRQNTELEDILKCYKADLYDFYAQSGKLPNYEGR